MSRLAIAVDGGNSKTDLALVDADGVLVSLVRGPSSSPHVLGFDGSAELLDSLLRQAVAQAGVPVGSGSVAAVANVLVAGADEADERAELHDRIERLGWSEQLVVDTDMPALLRAGTDRGWGIAVVCGAGINALGRAADGREARFLSLGSVSGDWGGGPDIGLAALGAAVRSADGRGPRTALESAVPGHFGMDGPLEVALAVHREQLPDARLDELVPIVVAECDRDLVAAEIVRRLVDEVIAFARAAISRLALSGADPHVVLGGRVLRAAPPGVVDAVARGVCELAPDACVVVSPSEPIVGAALLGLDALGAQPVARARARAELDAALVAPITSA